VKNVSPHQFFDGALGWGGIGALGTGASVDSAAGALGAAADSGSVALHFRHSEQTHRTTHLYTGTSTWYSFFTSFFTHRGFPHRGGGQHSSQSWCSPGSRGQISLLSTHQQVFVSFLTSRTTWQTF
jgi:hypothetical protein